MQLSLSRKPALRSSDHIPNDATPTAVGALNPRSGFALVEAVVSMALIGVLLGCAFTTDAQVLRILKRGKESSHATQVIQERVEQLRTSLWEEVTDPAKLANIPVPATATAVNLPEVTETITVEPLVNPLNLSATCVRTPAGAVTYSGAVLTNEKSVKVTMSIRWPSQGGIRTRGMVTIMTNGGI